jgi:chitin disaccharide deacetylase
MREKQAAVMGSDRGRRTGLLIINADDWGRDRETTDRTLHCVKAGSVSSVSAMVFMDDSDRAATIAREHAVDTGLHLNLTTPFSAKGCDARIRESQDRIARHLLRHRFSQILFNPGLMGAFDYVVKSQMEEFARHYGAPPSRIDGHHHMHLCANVLLQGLLPSDTRIRRNFSFEVGEKSRWNRCYRRMVDHRLARSYRLTDYFFSLVPFQPESRLERIVSLSQDHVVEVEVHPINKDEYEFLTKCSSVPTFLRIGKYKLQLADLPTGCFLHAGEIECKVEADSAPR